MSGLQSSLPACVPRTLSTRTSVYKFQQCKNKFPHVCRSDNILAQQMKKAEDWYTEVDPDEDGSSQRVELQDTAALDRKQV